ncbi:hypothetical protein VTN77DRAFT_2285 [Rasamsonia byssochlamydoides]|uniref:uncharacterized protein n=1 Tax=Rasamsonia byssochlamydoides TaxID=89139 RepID=UPI003742F9FA
MAGMDELYAWSRPDAPSVTDSSITRRMLQSEGATVDSGSSERHQPAVDLYSADTNASAGDVAEGKTDVDGLEDKHNQPLEKNVETAADDQVARLPPLDIDHDLSRSVDVSLLALINPDKHSTATSNPGQSEERPSDLQESQVDVSRGHDAPETHPPPPALSDREERSIPGNLPDSADTRDSESDAESDRPDSILHLTDCEFEDLAKSQPVSADDRHNLDANSSRFDQEHRSHPLSLENLRVSPLPHGKDRRLSSASQVSAISEEMDVRGRLDEAVHAMPNSHPLTMSQISGISNGMDGINDAVHQSEEADEGKAYNVLSNMPNETPSSLSQQRPRFSFESDGTRPEEAPPQFSDFPQADIPEDAPDEPPPPFPDPEADYLEDKKEEEEDAPPYNPPNPSQTQADAQTGLGISAAQDPPASQPPGPPVRQPQPSPAVQHGTRWRTTPLPSHSHTSSAPAGTPGVNVRRYYASVNPRPQSPPRQQQQQQPQQVVRADRQGETQQLSSTRGTGQFSGEHTRAASGPATPNSFLRTFSRPASDSQGSGDSMIANAAASRLDLRAEPSPLNQHTEAAPSISEPLKSKIKKIGKLPRMTHSGNAAAEGKKMSLSLISGLFNRSTPNSQRDKPEGHADGQRQVVQQNPPPGQPQYAAAASGHGPQPGPYFYGYTSVMERGPPMQQFKPTPMSYGSFLGQPPPPEGYYAPGQDYSPQDPSFAGYYLPTQQTAIPMSNPGYHYPTPPPQPQYQPVQYPVSAPYQQAYPSPLSHTHSTPSLHSAYSPSTTFSPPWSSRGDAPSPDRGRGRSRAEELHMRSRSPRPYPSREEQKIPGTDYSDPAHRLGKFNAVPETPRIGDQERPWSISLPEDPDEGRASRPPSLQPLQRAAAAGNGNLLSRPADRDAAMSADPQSHVQQLQQSQGSSTHEPPSSTHENQPTTNDTPNRLPRRYEEGPVIEKTSSPVELPATADDSSEEIVMSSTAYPGQEWHPAGYEHWIPY